MFGFDENVSALLRHVAHTSTGRRATTEDLRQALAEPIDPRLPPARLLADATLAHVLRRAADLAATRAASEIACRDLIEAGSEELARANGLDLDRLRFARWLVARTYVAPPASRRTSDRMGGIPA